MDVKVILVIVLLIIAIIRFFIKNASQKPYKYLFVSVTFQIVSMGYGLKLYSIPTDDAFIGAFGNTFRLELGSILMFFLLFLGYNKFDRIKFTNKLLYTAIILILILSLLNPWNPLSAAMWVPICFYSQLWLLFHIVKSNFSIGVIIKGIFDSFLVLTAIQLVLSICYPVLGLEFIGELFTDTLESSLKRENVISAVGTYGHPSSLAMVCLVYASFFYICFLNSYKKTISLFLFLSNLFIIYLTFSRTVYLISFFLFFIAYYLHKRALFSFKSIVFLIFGLISLAIIIFFTPIGDMFLNSDSELQVENRMTHWMIGYELWQRSKIIGLGINSHVYYMSNYMTSVNVGNQSDLTFYLTRPIHNIHIIVLVETGLIGLTTWLWIFASKLKNLYTQLIINKTYDRMLKLTAFSVLLIVFTYGFMGFGVFLKETSSMFLLILYFANTKKRMPVKFIRK